MASNQPFTPSFKPAAAATESEKPRPQPTNHDANGFNGETTTHHPESMVETVPSEHIGYLEVLIHHARDIQNICIYHKQDVYAKVYLTSDPEATVSTRTINGGGCNPVFNETLRLDVRTVNCSLKCEIYMLSRVKNYLEDQLLGIALVPLSNVVMANGKLEQEFLLSATDLYHSPSGFVQLCLSYVGSSPEVMVIPAPPAPVTADTLVLDAENDESIPSEYNNIEFPDLNVVQENHQMVSEYFGIPCNDLDSQTSESLITLGSGEVPDNEAGVHVVEIFAKDNSFLDVPRKDTPASSVSTDGSTASLSATSQSSSEQSLVTAVSPSKKDKGLDAGESEVDSSARPLDKAAVPPLIKLNLEPEQMVKQEDIVDMYMKSMQQFTESLAKMKLPMDIEKDGDNAENASSATAQKMQATKGTGSRVFYGSRAFF